jgi:hypothetical protein
MSAAEIIAELPRLSSAELAQIEAKLRELTEAAHGTALRPLNTARAHRIYSPRLVHPEQAKDFVKQVEDLPPDAKL